MAIVFLGIGSNMGDREQHIHDALSMLLSNRIVIDRISSLIETDPVGGPPQRKFINGVLKAETDLSPMDLLHLVKCIEKQIGRKPTVKNGPRPIDIDILLYDNIVINSPTLTIPHPLMFQRNFVMCPLKEILSLKIRTP